MINFNSFKKSTVVVIIIVSLFYGCSKKDTIKPETTKKPPVTNEGRYEIEQDIAPQNPDFDITTLNEWKIAPEPKSRYGNHSPYVVFGKTYYVADSGKKFEQTGVASWYGKKFHGHTTSNMEIFDMYKMTAAHRTLPLPSFVEVTNLDNNKKVIVRVNDRGPFKSKRIIDLSWAAAKALDYDKKGLTDVHIRLLQVPEKKALVDHVVELKEGMKFLQIGAFSQKDRALVIASELSNLVLLPVHVSETDASNPLFRVRIGPLAEEENIIDIIQKVHDKGYLNTKMVVE